MRKNEIQKLTHQSQNRINTYLKNKDQNKENQVTQARNKVQQDIPRWCDNGTDKPTRKENPQIKIPLNNTPSLRKESQSPNILNEIYSTMEKEKYKHSVKTEDLNTPQCDGSKETWIPGQVDLKLLSKHTKHSKHMSHHK